jgi:hypothetical protein
MCGKRRVVTSVKDSRGNEKLHCVYKAYNKIVMKTRVAFLA